MGINETRRRLMADPKTAARIEALLDYLMDGLIDAEVEDPVISADFVAGVATVEWKPTP